MILYTVDLFLNVKSDDNATAIMLFLQPIDQFFSVIQYKLQVSEAIKNNVWMFFQKSLW